MRESKWLRSALQSMPHRLFTGGDAVRKAFQLQAFDRASAARLPQRLPDRTRQTRARERQPFDTFACSCARILVRAEFRHAVQVRHRQNATRMAEKRLNPAGRIFERLDSADNNPQNILLARICYNRRRFRETVAELPQNAPGCRKQFWRIK